MQIEAKLKEFIANHLLFSPEGFAYTDDASFLREGIVDSIGVMELVSFVQSFFGISVDQNEVTPENFDSVAKLAAFIRRKLEATAGPASKAVSAGGQR